MCVPRLLEFAGAAALFVWATASMGADVDHLHVKERNAFALFQGFDTTGCIRTDVYVTAFEQKVNERGKISSGVATVLVSQLDQCSRTELLSAIGRTEAFSLTVQPSLKRANLRADLLLTDFVQGVERAVSVNITWTATAKKEHFHTNNYFELGSLRVHTNYNGFQAPAQVFGSISDGRQEFLTVPKVEAFIQRLNFGQVEIVRE